MRKLFPSLLLVILYKITVGQVDSSYQKVVFGNNLQHTYNPALTSQMGKHVARTDLFTYRQPNNGNAHITWLDGYHTQLGKHGIGVTLHYIGNTLYDNWSYSLQYSYRFQLLKKKQFWQNTFFSFGGEFGATSFEINHETLKYADQIDPQFGFIYDTSEPKSGSILYPNITGGFTLRSNRLYIASHFQNIQAINNTNWDYQLMFMQTHHYGLKVWQHKHFQTWLTGNITNSFPVPIIVAYGPTVSYKNAVFTYAYNTFNQHQIRLGYFENDFRVYAEWVPIPIVNNHIFRFGLAYSIQSLWQ